jgi:hypothetical protein
MRRISKNVEASNSRNPKGLHGLYRDNFIFTYVIIVCLHTTTRPVGIVRQPGSIPTFANNLTVKRILQTENVPLKSTVNWEY